MIYDKPFFRHQETEQPLVLKKKVSADCQSCHHRGSFQKQNQNYGYFRDLHGTCTGLKSKTTQGSDLIKQDKRSRT